MENQIEKPISNLIYLRMAKCMQEVGAIGKEQTNSQQGFKYRGIDDVMNGIHDIFANNNIFIIPSVVELTRTERTNTKGTVLFYVTAKMNYKFVTDDGSYIECTITGEGMDSGDKATTKAMSIALKYALTQMLLIPTAEPKDPDAESHELKDEKAKHQTHKPLKEKAKETAIQQMLGCKDLESVKQCWTRWKVVQNEDDFIRVKEEMKNKFNTVQQ